MRIRAAAAAEAESRELRLRRGDQRIDAGMALALQHRVAIGRLLGKGGGDEVAPARCIALVPAGDVAVDDGVVHRVSPALRGGWCPPAQPGSPVAARGIDYVRGHGGAVLTKSWRAMPDARPFAVEGERHWRRGRNPRPAPAAASP